MRSVALATISLFAGRRPAPVRFRPLAVPSPLAPPPRAPRAPAPRRFAGAIMASSSAQHVPPAPMVSRFYEPASVAGKCALITGASSGIGLATAERLAELGCRLVIAARRADRLEALAKRLEQAFGAKVHCATLDVTDADAVLALPAALPAEFADVSILVNNAGGALGTSSVATNDMSDVEFMLDANVKGLVACTRAFSPGMVERNEGHIVNISSIAAVEWYKGGSVYCASKAAVSAFTYAARKDLFDTPVRVTSISPGFVETEFAKVRFKGDEKKAAGVYEGMKFGGPLVAEDVADNIVYAVTRPGRVQICDVLVYPTSQASTHHVARE